MAYSLDIIQEDVLEFLATTVFPGQKVVEQANPTIDIAERTSTGKIKPYVAVELGDIQPWGSTSFVGAQGDDYVLPVYLRIVAPDPSIGRSLRNRAIRLFLGSDFDWAGEIRKRVSGGQMPLTNDSGDIECYIFPASFGLGIQLSNEA